MGDRRMAEIKMEGGSLYVYTHWGGAEMPELAEAAIMAAKPRWSDQPYAARILVDQLTKEGRDKETGFGLMVKPVAEDEYNDGRPSVIINLTNQTLTVIDRDGELTRTFQEVKG